MSKILVLGAGMVSRPLIGYLLEEKRFQVTVADVDVNKARAVVGRNNLGKAISFNVQDLNRLNKEVSDADVVVSILPPPFHPDVAKLCLSNKKHLVTSSYVPNAIQAMDKEARDLNIVFLNELGLDPGIDHMSAMKIIHEVQSQGGKIVSFASLCGALPDPDNASSNPLSYKFSWSPLGAFRAMRNDGVYLENGEEVTIPSSNLFANPQVYEFNGIGRLEAYPNRDSLRYIDLYGIQGVKDMLRGTLRYPGWCKFWNEFSKTGILEETQIDFSDKTFAGFMRERVGADSDEILESSLTRIFGIQRNSEIMEKIRWLGLFSSEIIPEVISLDIPEPINSPLAVLSHLALQRMRYAAGEVDMVVLHHEFKILTADGNKSKRTSTLIEYGIPDGDSAISRTVGLPAAIGAALIAEGKLPNIKGVVIPTVPEIFNNVLSELQRLGIKPEEKEE
jgi:saccharopine dehydrogenase-like NADP-dependent oxidoreductase